jgi:cell division septation protein DedD
MLVPDGGLQQIFAFQGAARRRNQKPNWLVLRRAHTPREWSFPGACIVNFRNIDQIQEESDRRGLPLATLFLSALAGGALVVAAMTSFEREAPPTEAEADPLAELLERAKDDGTEPAVRVSDEQVTFPKILSDDGTPTTALAAVKDERGRMLELDAPRPAQQAGDASAAADALPRAELPVGDLLSATRVTTDPNDELGQLARSRVASGEAGEMAPPGAEGGYEIQVASFQNPAEADAFVEELRRRGHRAYRQAAYVPDRGLWHRVRIGPFKHKYLAQNYQKKLDAEQRIQSFLVDPAKVKRQKAIRDAKLKKREAKKKRKSGTAVIRPAQPQ